MTRARIDENKWCRCGKCGHKLFRTLGENDKMEIEIKCHSCKEINRFGANKEK